VRVRVVPIIEVDSNYGGISLAELRKTQGLEVSHEAYKKLQEYQKRGYTLDQPESYMPPVRIHKFKLEYMDEDPNDARHVCQNRGDPDTENVDTENVRRRYVKGLNQWHLRRRDVTVGNGFSSLVFGDNNEEESFDNVSNFVL
jgi:hypothetical protein